MTEQQLEHKTLEAKAVATDRGEFSAIAAAYTVDRVKDQIVRGAFAKTIAAWQSSGKRIPLHYDHKGDPQYIIGSVDPGKLEEREEGLYIEGNIDLEGSEVGREAWRAMKSNAMSLSFGYLEAKTKKRSDGIKELVELDVFEFTVTPAPVQPDTRFLSLKSAQREESKALSVQRDPARCSIEEPWAVMDGDEIASCHATEAQANVAVRGMEQVAEGKGVSDSELPPEAWRLIFAGLLDDYRPAKSTRTEPPVVERVAEMFPDVQTEDDFKALSPSEKLDIYYATLDSEDGLGQKTVWSTAYVNDLPDSHFLYVESGDKDDEGKTVPRAKRHFPYKSAEGTVDLSHLRNALARIPQSNLPEDVKTRVAAKARRILDDQKSLAVEGQNEEPSEAKSAPMNPLVREAWDLIARDAYGAPLPKHIPEPESEPEPEPLNAAQLQNEAWALITRSGK